MGVFQVQLVDRALGMFRLKQPLVDQLQSCVMVTWLRWMWLGEG
jgi:hypothetical protein